MRLQLPSQYGMFGKETVEPGFCCIGITDYCFFRCKMCNKWKEDLSINKEISRPPKLSEWKSFISSLAKTLPRRKLTGKLDERFEINFAGGESLTHPYTLELVRFASDLGFRTVIPSNGFLVDEKMARKLSDTHLSALNLSLDSLDPKIHDEFRGKKGAYDGIMKAIESLKGYKSPKIGIISIIHGETYKGTVDLVRWASSHPVLKWILTMAIMQPNNTIYQSGWYEKPEFESLWPDDSAAVVSVIDELIKIKKQQIELTKKGINKGEKLVNTLPQLNAFKRYFSNPERFVKNQMNCNFDTAIQVSAVGDIYMCYHFGKIGNVSKDDFRISWNSSKAANLRKAIAGCKTNCHELLNCYYREEYPFSVK